LALKQFYIKNVGPAKIQRVQQKIPGCWTYVQQNENKFQKVCYAISAHHHLSCVFEFRSWQGVLESQYNIM
jgi:hypothetical protein